MTFNPLKRIIKSTLNRDPIQQIFWGSPTIDTYNKVLHNYRSMPSQYRLQVINRCLKKLYKPKQFDLVLANLVLIHKIMKINYLVLPIKQPQLEQISNKKQINMAQKKFIQFYFKFMKQEQNKMKMKVNQIQEKVEYCTNALNNCNQLIKNNIVIDYCLNHSINQLTLRMAMKQIFEELRKDLEFCTNFIQSNAKSIYEQNNETSFMINQVYENLIYVNKNLSKISVLIKKSGFSINLPTYQLNRDLNMKIQMQMNARKNQRMKFKTQKNIKSKKIIQKNQENENENIKYYRRNISQSLSQIDQDQILINNEEIF